MYHKTEKPLEAIVKKVSYRMPRTNIKDTSLQRRIKMLATAVIAMFVIVAQGTFEHFARLKSCREIRFVRLAGRDGLALGPR